MSTRAARRARTLIELMMKEMYAGLADPDRLADAQWDKLFGAKQSMIANLQKLVATLNDLAEMEVETVKTARPEPLTPADVALLTAWINDSNESI